MLTELNPNLIASQLAAQFLENKTAADYLRSLVLSRVIEHSSVGAQLFIANQDGKLGVLASFGTNYCRTDQILSIMDDHPVARAIATNQEAIEELTLPETGQKVWLHVYPYRRPSHAVGACVLTNTSDYHVVLDPEVQNTLSLMGALWLESLGIRPAKETTALSDVTDLTPRQTEVLSLIVEGFTNREIASQLFLSESTIKQETAKIYRVLGVVTRQAAATKAVALDLI